MRDENQLHAAVVELVALDDAEIKYSTVQNWYPGDKDGKGGIYNFVTKRGDCRARIPRSAGRRSRPARRSPGNTRAASCAATTASASSTRSRSPTAHQQADTGTKMIHLGKNTRRADHLQGHRPGKSQNTYRGLVSMHRKAKARATSPSATRC
jgi:Fe-S cluster assembly protein SufB